MVLSVFFLSLIAGSNGDACVNEAPFSCGAGHMYDADGFGMGFGGLRDTRCTNAPKGVCCGGNCCSDYNGKWIHGPSAREIIGRDFMDNIPNCLGKSNAITCEGNQTPPDPWAERYVNNPLPGWESKFENTFTHTDPSGDGDWILDLIKPALTDAQKAQAIAEAVFAGASPVLKSKAAGVKGKILAGMIGGTLEFTAMKVEEGAPAMKVDLSGTVKKLVAMNELKDVKDQISTQLALVEVEMADLLSFHSDLQSDVVLSNIQTSVKEKTKIVSKAYKAAFMNAWIDESQGGSPVAAYFLYQPMFSLFQQLFELRKLQFVTTLAMVSEETTVDKAIEWKQQACKDMVTDYMYGGSLGDDNIASFNYQWNQFVLWMKTALKARTDAVTQPTCTGSNVNLNTGSNVAQWAQHFDAGATFKDTWSWAAEGTVLPTYSVGWKAIAEYRMGNGLGSCSYCKLQYEGQAIPDKASFDAFMAEQRDAYVGQIEAHFADHFEKYLTAKDAMWKFMRTTEMICERALDANWMNTQTSNGPEQFCMKIEPQEFINTPEGSAKLGIHEGQWSSTARVNLFDFEKADYGLQQSIGNGLTTEFDTSDCTFFQGFRYAGGDLPEHDKRINGVDSAYACKSLCDQDQHCSRWSFHELGSCFLRAYSTETKAVRAVLAPLTESNWDGQGWTAGKGLEDQCTGYGGRLYSPWFFTALPYGSTCPVTNQAGDNLVRARFTKQISAGFSTETTEHTVEWAQETFFLNPSLGTVAEQYGINTASSNLNGLTTGSSNLYGLTSRGGPILDMVLLPAGKYTVTSTEGKLPMEATKGSTDIALADANGNVIVDLGHYEMYEYIGETVTWRDETAGYPIEKEYEFVIENPTYAKLVYPNQPDPYYAAKISFRYEAAVPAGKVTFMENGWSHALATTTTQTWTTEDQKPKTDEEYYMALSASCGTDRDAFRRTCEEMCLHDESCGGYMIESEAASSSRCSCTLTDMTCQNDAFTLVSDEQLPYTVDEIAYQRGHRAMPSSGSPEYSPLPAGTRCRSSSRIANQYWDHHNLNEPQCLTCPISTLWMLDTDEVKAQLHETCTSHTQADQDHMVELCQDKCDKTQGCTGFSVATDAMWKSGGCLCVLYEGAEACDVRDTNPNYQTFTLREDNVWNAVDPSTFAYGGVQAEVEIYGGQPGSLEVRFSGTMNFRTDVLSVDPPTFNAGNNHDYTVSNNMGLSGLATANDYKFHFQSDDMYICPKGTDLVTNVRRLERTSSLAERLAASSM